MNRIILIGNGFDLAHGLKTSYKSFIEWVWKDSVYKIGTVSNENRQYEDSNIKVFIDIKPSSCYVHQPISETYAEYLSKKSKPDSYFIFNEFIHSLNNQNSYTRQTPIIFELKNEFLESLLESHSNKEWVDIEEEYYKKLKELSKESDNQHKIKKLNKELEQVKDLLDEYLQEVATSAEEMGKFDQLIYSPFMISDFINNAQLKELLIPILNQLKLENDKDVSVLNIACCKTLAGLMSDYYCSRHNDCLRMLNWEYLLSLNIDEILTDPHTGLEFMNNCAVPKDILFLNFNYTPTAKQYAETGVSIRDGKTKNFKVNHIHGELNQKTVDNLNPMIFGYGDEISEEYTTLENLNDNTLLENVKSIRYLETNNYRDLIQFIESDEYQIYIMGHSCGISDRTLLNTLFEHENCVSIKPFYYEWTDEGGIKHDNYRELVQNISRNFGDKIMMRNKVVNKTYCLPLPQRQKNLNS